MEEVLRGDNSTRVGEEQLPLSTDLDVVQLFNNSDDINQNISNLRAQFQQHITINQGGATYNPTSDAPMMADPASSHQHHHHYDMEEDMSDSDASSDGQASANNSGTLHNRPPPKKRNRAALSCTLCRERKVKCDRVIPCQQCIKRGDAQFCHLDPSKRGPKPKASRSKQASQSHSEQFMAPSMEDVKVDVKPQMAPPQPYQLPRQQSSAYSPSSASSASEVDAIKTRLAQLEQMLAQRGSAEVSPGFSGMSATGAPSDVGSATGLSPRYSWNQQSSILHPGAPTQFVTSPHNQRGSLGASPNSISYRSGSASTPPRQGSGGPNLVSLFAQQHNTAGAGADLSSASSLGRIEASASDRSSHVDKAVVHSNRGAVDSDTEDAALVLEGLAMGSRNECGEKKPLKPERAAIEIIENAPVKSIQGFVEEDKAEDIMTEGKYRFEKKGAAEENKSCDKGLPKNAAEIVACNVLRDFLHKNPDAEFGPDGQRLSPAKRVCVLLSDHNSLFNLVWGPETFLGWGLGWAFPAAEAAGDMMNVSEIVGCKGALQREAVLRAIIRSLPHRELAEHLIDVFDSRVKFLAGNTFHMPTLRKELSAFYDLATVEKRARVINFVDPAWLSLILMIFVLALHFHPCERPELASHLFDGRTIHLWRSAAQTCLVLARYQSSTSMAVLQTIILINLLAMGQGKENFNLTNTAISNALEMGLHRLGDKDKQPKAGESPAIAIRREMAKRIWHQLTFTDWCSATMHAGAHRIHPHQYNTPVPGNYNDADLCQSPQPAPRPETEHTDMSFPLAMLKLADIARQNSDMIYSTEQRRVKCADMAYLDTSYRGLLEKAPSFYKIGSDEGAGENIEVERWLFQQSVFHKLLRLHRPQLSSRTSARTSCVLLARSILDMQRRIRSRCSVVDRLFANLAQSFSAAIVLCLDLLQTRPNATMRSIVRGEISEALKALRHVGASHHTTENSIRVIEALLAEEEARWNSPGSGNPSDATGKRRRDGKAGERRKDMLNLALRVAKAAQGENGSGEDAEMADGEQEESDEDGQNGGNADPQAAEQRHKDEQSRQMFEQLLTARPAYAEPSSFSNAPYQANIFNQPAGTMAPNGLDFGGTGWTPPETSNGQAFDLTKFLAEAEANNSPGNENVNSSAASDSGHSSLHGGGPGSSSSGRISHSSSFNNGNTQSANGRGSIDGASATAASNSPVDAFGGLGGPHLSPSAFERPSTNMDGFWNWVLTQGAMGLGAAADVPQAPLGGNGAPVQRTSQPTGPASVSLQAGSNAQEAQQYMTALAQNLGGGMGANPVGDAILPTTSTASDAAITQNASVNPFATRTPTNSTAGGGNELPFYSVGTPSAGMGSSWMSTPGLFDFAYEFGDGAHTSSTAATAAAGST